MYGQQYREQIIEVIRHAAELCDCLQCFFLIHSMGGGECFFPLAMSLYPELTRKNNFGFKIENS